MEDQSSQTITAWEVSSGADKGMAVNIKKKKLLLQVEFRTSRDSGRVQISMMAGTCLSLDIRDASAAVASLVCRR